jgi:ribosomal protein S18 acetylase RimI-like enzyme
MKLELVPCQRPYWDFVRRLRTDPRVQPGFTEQVDEITPAQQEAYMGAHAHEYWVCLCDGEPAGYVGNVGGDIRVAVHPDYQRRGVGRFLIEELERLVPGGFAKVKVDNEASRALFEACGFKVTYYILERG